MRALCLALLLPACAAPEVRPAPARSEGENADFRIAPEEKAHFKSLKQLTLGGENAEAYWSFEGRQLSYQARVGEQACDRIRVMDPFASPPTSRQLSSGKGATTCAHFFPGAERLLYASTQLAGDACPPKPDMSLGYVWSLHDGYDIFSVKADGSDSVRLTDTPGYDAEGTVCGKDGSIVFTSVRDGDLELYRMDQDGRNVRRLTNTPGYDGGAFFNADCTKLVWRASRPKVGKDLEDYRALLARGLVRPTKLELMVANADGTDARQVTYLNAGSFAPFFHPTRERILFSSNAGDPKGREFDLWAVNTDGTQLERITFAKGFDGFPMFSPDGKYLAFSSNRATAEGQSDTNMFLAEWSDGPALPVGTAAADRLAADVRWLAAPEREGRGLGTAGLVAAGAYLEERFKALGLEPFGEPGSFRAGFEAKVGVRVAESTALKLGGLGVSSTLFTPLGGSGQGAVSGSLVFAGYGLEDPASGFDDYKGLDVKKKLVVVRRFVPEGLKTEQQRALGDLRRKAFVARSHGAAGLLVVDWPAAPVPTPKDWALPPEAALPRMTVEGSGDAGLPVLVVKRAALDPVWSKLTKKQKVEGSLTVALAFETAKAFNVVARLKAGAASTGAGVVLVGAHYDHLGLGGANSLTPDKVAVHPGADDNASGAAALLEVARLLVERRAQLSRDVVFAAFSGEEEGILGSSALVKARADLVAPGSVMLNLDMVGRLRGNAVAVLGTDTSDGWRPLLEQACGAARLTCDGSGDGYGPSDQTSFYAAGAPVLHFFTGAHGDYHKPSDTPDKLNAAGAAQVALAVAEVASAATSAALAYNKVSAPVRGDLRSFGASLGTIPNYGEPPAGLKGVLLDDVRPGGGAALGGMRKGDVLIKLGTYEVRSVEDLMFVLTSARPGETVGAVVVRGGAEVRLEVTFQEGRRR